MNNHIATVQSIYKAFGSGDVPGILNHLADNIQWEYWTNNFAQNAGVPWMKKCNTKTGVVEFFQIVGSFKMNSFKVINLLSGGNSVAAEIEIDFVYAPTGARVFEEEIHYWTFNAAGKVTHFRHYLDTAKHIAAVKGR